MCVTWPAQVVAIDPQGATVDTEGRRRRASTVVVPDVAVGDWVLVGMGTILLRLDPEVAMEMRGALREAVALDEAAPQPAIAREAQAWEGLATVRREEIDEETGGPRAVS
jgi:hydrogenase expression/formation protein HypC